MFPGEAELHVHLFQHLDSSFIFFDITVKILPKPGWDLKQYFEKPEGDTNF